MCGVIKLWTDWMLKQPKSHWLFKYSTMYDNTTRWEKINFVLWVLLELWVHFKSCLLIYGGNVGFHFFNIHSFNIQSLIKRPKLFLSDLFVINSEFTKVYIISDLKPLNQTSFSVRSVNKCEWKNMNWSKKKLDMHWNKKKWKSSFVNLYFWAWSHIHLLLLKILTKISCFDFVFF